MPPTTTPGGSRPGPERLDRNWSELLQELRVSQTGVQLLSGFLLTVPFSNRFADLDAVQRTTYLVVFTGALAATALLVAPVAFHRVLFRRHRRLWIVEAANWCARLGLLALAATTSGVLFLVFDLVLGRTTAAATGAAAAVVFLVLWWVLPAVSLLGTAGQTPAGDVSGGETPSEQ